MGSFVISIDAELGWGFHDLPDPPTDRLDAARSGWLTLLDVLDAHDVPATWAVVGHLMLETCDGVHADHPSIGGWFGRERGSWRDRPDLRFGTELVRAVLDSSTDHEIACHTFSHVLFDDPRVTREIAGAELRAAADAGRSLDVSYDSLVFPRNAVGHRDLLPSYGISCYRGRPSEPSIRPRRIAGKILATIAPGRVDLVEPTVDEFGLVDVPPSLYLFGFEGTARTVAEALGVDPIVRQAKRGIDRASREDGVFHVWLHPNNVRTKRDVRRLREIVEHATRRRSETGLRIETMGDVASRIRRRVRSDEYGRRLTPSE